MIYLDHNATTPLRPAALQMMTEVLHSCGNPSSVHSAGRKMRARLDAARHQLAVTFDVGSRGEVVFTSGGTEANALALQGAGIRAGRAVLVAADAHPSLTAVPGVQRVPVDGRGIVDVAALAGMLDAARQAQAGTGAMAGPLLALGLVNTETGVVQPLAEIVPLVQAAQGWLHLDAVQAAGKMAVRLQDLGCQSLAVSAHKLGGPQGVGALLLADESADLVPLLAGGGQEKRRRSGTENVAGICAFAVAAEQAVAAQPEQSLRWQRWQQALEAVLRDTVPDLQVMGADVPRIGSVSCLARPGVSAQTLVMRLDLDGIMVSAGSACSSGKVGPSPVLLAMGRADLAGSALRVSQGWTSTAADGAGFLAAYLRCCAVSPGQIAGAVEQFLQRLAELDPEQTILPP